MSLYFWVVVKIWFTSLQLQLECTILVNVIYISFYVYDSMIWMLYKDIRFDLESTISITFDVDPGQRTVQCKYEKNLIIFHFFCPLLLLADI
jgi:hypothetical protein